VKNEELRVAGMRIRSGAILVLWGVLGVLLGCERDIKEGSTVVVEVSIRGAEYEEIRGFGAEKAETEAKAEGEAGAETVTISLNDDYYLRATLRPEAEETAFDGGRLREASTSELADGQKVCLAAFKLDGTQVGSMVHYTYSRDEAKLEPVGEPLEVEVNATYRFVAYSYYNNVPDEFPAVTSIDPNDRDLVCAVIEKEITANDRTLAILLKHLASRVRVRVSTSRITGSSIGSMGEVSILGGRTAALTGNGFAATGTVVSYDDIEMTGSGDTQMSDYFPFYPSPTGVNISSIEILSGASVIYTDNVGFSVKFTQALEGGEALYAFG
jgi:hypothetical protein